MMNNRLIPAHAGKTAFQEANGGLEMAHPRSRGENLAALPVGLDTYGSSPLTRGKHRRGAGSWRIRRLIPAHAGKTRTTNRMRYLMRAHPRSRGENEAEGAGTGATTGSSPLTRGKLSRGGSCGDGAGLIPAHAGKTRMQARELSTDAAHPRSRGENLIGAVRTLVVTGSSPLTRGKPLGGGVRARGDRLIPAHAGKTMVVTSCVGAGEAHPRSRGENMQLSSVFNPVSGSSPLTRGKPVLTPPLIAEVRLIPAHAGKTGHRRGCAPPGRAHPRSRGEND